MATAPWDRLYVWAEKTLSLEGQEQLVSLMLEPYGTLIDDLADHMGADEEATFPIDGAMSLSRLKQIVWGRLWLGAENRLDIIRQCRARMVRVRGKIGAPLGRAIR